MKKVLALMGSPRRNKNTEKLLDYLLDGIDKSVYDVNKVVLKNLDINHCTGCEHCGRTSNCAFKDDMIDIYNGFDDSDIIILASPLYFNSINGLSKNMVDRCQRYWSIKYVLGENYKRNETRKGIFLSVGGAPFTHNQFDGTIPIIDYFFKAINAEYAGNYFVSNTDNNPIIDRLEVQQELNIIGNEIDDLKNFYLHR
ncbi:flavodoxin family protein [Tissierella sp. Yu-01]|uniref:flavodoxin family protein n=1 Tax=Tissierella sp. Yu-01 TaxID=3035694 RepID=UPI00240E6925|nr:flavodoxin family protein [Tissierella sp. Yu-01]WFA09617.1 flavodoxin family protein [Tissierella sp. Yu-01]